MVVYSSAGDFDSVIQANGTLVHIPTAEEKKLASLLKHAGNSKKGPQEWQKLYAKYTGNCPVVLNAAMHAALKQRDYHEGYQVYKRVRDKTLATYSVSIQLLGKLGQQDEVQRLWEELIKLNLVNQVLAAARIAAAADAGEIEAAAQVLGYMEEKGIEANVVHFTSAINACANAKDSDRAKQAQALFDTMLAKGVEPNIVTYVNLLRAFQDEPSQCCLDLLANMKEHHVKPNQVFAENFLFIFLRKGDGDWRKQSIIASHLRKLNPVDLQFAKSFIDDLRKGNIRLNKSSQLIDSALQTVLREQVLQSG